jgi:DNA-binding Xre family transcriptional regulator
MMVSMKRLRWKLAEYLEAHELTGYKLREETRLSSNTIYPLIRGTVERIDTKTLQRILAALKSLTGKEVSVCNLLEYEQEKGE